MPCINVKLKSYANGEVTLQEVIDKVMDETSATQPPIVKREKGGDGKLFKAMICFLKDTITKEDLKTARDICSGHVDVDFGVQFPLDFQDNLEASTADATLTDDKIIGNPTSSEIPFCRVTPDDAEAGFRVSSAGEGNGGGLALAIVDLDTASVLNQHRIDGIVRCNAADIPDITDITAWKIKFDHKRVKTWNTPADQPDRVSSTINFSSQSLVGNANFVRINPFTFQYIYQYRDSLGVFNSINTGIVWDGSYKTLSLELLPNGDVVFDLNGEWTHTYSLGVAMPTPDLRINTATVDQYDTARAVAQEPVLMDNIEFTINDGTLV